MAQFEVTFQNDRGDSIIKDIPGKDQADAGQYAESVAQRGYQVASVEAVRQTDSCHYCGMPARSSGFFDEPVCRECDG